MKKIALSCLLFLASCVFLQAQDKQAILRVLETQRIAWNKGDIEGYMQGYWKSDSLLFVGKSAPAYGWQTTLDHYKKGYPDKAAMGSLTFDILQAWHLKREKDAPGGYFTLWLKKIDGEWKIVCDHTS
jgi:ketosteroid isomerase-like protein